MRTSYILIISAVVFPAASQQIWDIVCYFKVEAIFQLKIHSYTVADDLGQNQALYLPSPCEPN